MALLCLLLMAAFYLAVIIGQPQEDETASTVTPRMDQPLLSAGQDVVTITSADDLPLLLRMFPAPPGVQGAFRHDPSGLPEKISKALDSCGCMAYYLGRRAAFGRLFPERKVSQI